jgi:4-hydroxyphenylpyruvate dioxygenase-like putative hemolysin
VSESREEPHLHHAVLAVGPQRLPEVARMFTDLGFRFAEFELDDVGLRVWLDWARGLELVTPIEPDPDNPVQQFLDRHGDGVFSLAVRVGDAPRAEEIARRYGAITKFRQHRDGDGWQLDEIEMTVLGLPITLLCTDLP